MWPHTWRQRLHKGLTTQLEESRRAETRASEWVELLQERVSELERQLAAEDGVLMQTQRELEIQRELGQAAVRARSRFLSRMSEELNAPLHGIVDQAELLR